MKNFTLELQNAHAADGNLIDKQTSPSRWLRVDALTKDRTSNSAVCRPINASGFNEQLAIVEADSDDNRGVVPDCMAGTGAEPLVLDQPWYVRPGSRLRLFGRSTSGAANTVRLNLHGVELDGVPDRYELGREPCWMGLYKSVSANGHSSGRVQAPAGYRFEGVGITRSVTSDAFTYRLKHSRRGFLSGGPLYGAACSGTLGQPFPLSVPLHLADDETLRIELADLSGSTNAIYFYLFGWLYAL